MNVWRQDWRPGLAPSGGGEGHGSPPMDTLDALRRHCGKARHVCRATRPTRAANGPNISRTASGDDSMPRTGERCALGAQRVLGSRNRRLWPWPWSGRLLATNSNRRPVQPLEPWKGIDTCVCTRNGRLYKTVHVTSCRRSRKYDSSKAFRAGSSGHHLSVRQRKMAFLSRPTRPSRSR